MTNPILLSQSTLLYVKQRENAVFKRFIKNFDDAFDGIKSWKLPSDSFQLCHVLSFEFKRGMNIPLQRNLRRRMSQHLAEGFYLKSHLNAPCCERVPQHVKMHILNVASRTVFFDVILQGTRLNYPDNVFDGDEYYNVL